ncbi:MAG: sugar-binding protein [Phycisphaeraceae bacterium]
MRSWIGTCVAFFGLLWIAVQPALADDFDPHRLLLTWQRDPTSTMTIQWLSQGRLLPTVDEQSDEATPPAVPDVGEVAVDGAADWWDRGLPLPFLADDNHVLPDPARLAAEARLGWNDQGLLVLVRVQNQATSEHEDIDQLWREDSVELFVSDGVGSNHRYQVVIAPGLDPDHDTPRHKFYEKSGGPAANGLTVDYAVRQTDDGYVMEVLLPWSNLEQLDAERDATVAFQLYVNDSDGEATQWVSLYPARDTSQNASAKYDFTLADEAGAAVLARGELVEVDGQLLAHVHGLRSLAGEAVSIRSGERELVSGVFEAHGRTARAELALPVAPEGRRWGRMTAVTGERRLATFQTAFGTGAIPPGPVDVTYWPADDREAQATATTAVAGIEQWPAQFRQRVEITGLEPGTAYRFQAAGHPDDYGFRTMPADLRQPLRIAMGGDTRHTQAWMERTNRIAMRYRPDFIIWGGDLAYANAREDALNLWEEWFDAVGNTLIDDDGYVVPIVVAIGNHEVRNGSYVNHEGFEPTDEWRQRLAPYFYQFFAFPGQPGYGVLDFADYLSVVVLDSRQTNPVAGEQTRWLGEVLADRADVPHVLPIYHVAAHPSHRPYGAVTPRRIREHWVPLFEQHGIRLAFEHDDHTYKRTPPIRDGEPSADGVVYLGDGAWGVGVRDVHDPAETWYLDRAESMRHAIILTLHGTHQHVLVVDENGEILDEYPATGLIRRVDDAE